MPIEATVLLGFKWFFRGQVHFQEKLAEQQTRLMERLPRSDSEKNTSNYRGWTHPRPPLTRCVDLKSCRIYQNPKLNNPGIPGSGTQTKDVSHLNRHKPTLYNLTSDRRVKQRTKEPKSQSHPSELRGTLRRDWPFQKAHPQCQDLLPHQPKKLPQQHPRDRSRASR